MNVLMTQQLTWPNNSNPKVIQVLLEPPFLLLMASVPTLNYVSKHNPVPMPDAELGLAVDPALAFESPIQEPIYRPPGVTTLRQWGNQVFPEGKHQGATFISVYNKDPKYTAYMKGHSNLTSPWAKSFQNFIKAVSMPVISHQTPCLTPKGSVSPSTSEWDLLSSPGPSQTPVTQVKGKRGQSEIEEKEEMAKMDLVKDAEKEQKLMTQIAILQREVDQLKQGNP